MLREVTHFTFDKNSSGPDHFYSLSPDELNTLIKNIRYIETTLGDQEKNISIKSFDF